MRIGLVLDDSLDTPDGVQQYVLSLGRWLTSQGHEVHYLTGQTMRQDIANLHSLSHNMAVRFNRNRMSIPLPVSRHAARKFLHERQFDVLHVQMPYSPWLAGKLIAEVSPQTVVVGTFHIAPYSHRVTVANKLLRMWLGPTIKRFDHILSVSPIAHDFARKTFGLESTIVPNMVDVKRFATARKKPVGDKTHNLVFLGRFVERKGCSDLLQAVRILVHERKLTTFHLTIGGRGPLEHKLKAYVFKHRLEPYVTFAGFVPEADKPKFLAAADIAVFPSHGGESFGIVLIEAMASGALTLAAHNSGYAWVLADNPKVLFKPRDAQGLATMLAVFLQDTAARHEVQQWEQTLLSQYTQATVGAKVLRIYQQALRKKRGA